MEPVYVTDAEVSAEEIAALRRSVGWNGMQSCYENPDYTSYLHIACYDGSRLAGYVDTVCNRVTDAYIQDLMVHPDYQGRGIGTELMNRVITALKERRIYMISVVYEKRLQPFYRRFGFMPMLCGQMQTYDCD